MGKKKAVRCVETGQVFESLTAAGLSIGQFYPRTEATKRKSAGGEAHHSNVAHVARGDGHAKTAGGYHWEFLDNPLQPILNEYLKPEDKLPKIYKAIKRKPPKQPKIDYPPEGYVYIFRNDWHPENVYKIGSTDNLEGRRSAARTWGPYKCEFFLEVSDCKLVESKVHAKLAEYKVDRDDLGSEHFTVELPKAIQSIFSATLDMTIDRLKEAA